MTKILDCTIRDGGHLNDWNFSKEFVKSAYETAAKSGVDFFEIGYRRKNPPQNFGEFSRCNDEFLFNLISQNPNCKLSLMIDAGKSDLNDFKPFKNDLTPISFVRVSTYPDELETAFELCEGLLERNYGVFLNLMAVSEFKKQDYEKLEKWEPKSFLESVYFADSFGSFLPDDIEKFYTILKNIGIEKISFHSHNNLQLAFANTLKTLELNFYSVDATIFGMGRGAGNLPIELLLGYLQKQNYEKYNPVFYLEFIEKNLAEMKKYSNWGYTIPHVIGGLKNIHPNYTEELAEKKYSFAEILKISDLLKNEKLISYNKNKIREILK